MSALDDIIVAYQDAGGLRTELPPKARAELATLCARLAELETANTLFLSYSSDLANKILEVKAENKQITSAYDRAIDEIFTLEDRFIDGVTEPELTTS